MKPGITIRRFGAGDDPMRLEISSSDGSSLFHHSVYAGFNALKKLVEGLGVYRKHIHGGLYNIQFGQFGPEYGGGAFEARFHSQAPGKLFVSIKAESEWAPFKKAEVASSATLYMRSEPVLLDNFIEELRRLDAKEANEATLVCI